MKPNYYRLIGDAVEDGIRGFLWNDLDSETEKDDERVERLTELAFNRIMNAICERFDFDGDE